MTKNNFSKIISILFFSVFLSVNFCSAQSFSVTTDKKIYNANEQVKISINIADKSLVSNIRGTILLPNETRQPIYDLDNIIKDSAEIIFDIYDTMPNGEYSIEIVLLENEKIKEEITTVFIVQGMKEYIIAKIKFCEDQGCANDKAVFIKDEPVFIKLDSNISDLNISATIKTPSGEIKRITFENNFAEFKSAEAGSFSLWVNLSKQDYLNRKIKKDFAYLDKPAEIQSASVCNANGKCENEENEQNCPQDCSLKITKISNLYIFVAVILIIVTGIIIFALKRKRSN